MLKMLKHYYLKRSKTFQYASAGLTILLVAALGTLILDISRAASPNVTFSATGGTLAGGSSPNQSCAGASGNSCVVFGQQLAMDGNVALALMSPGTPFAPSSFWNTPLPSNTPVNTNNPEYLNAIKNNICKNAPIPPATSFIATTTPTSCTNTNYYGALNAYAYSAPLYVVPANQPTINVNVAPGCNTTSSAFAAALANVPVPSDAHGSGQVDTPASLSINDTDQEIQIYQPSADNGNGKYWDFWRFKKDVSGNWEACWGGAIDNVSQSNGVFASNGGAMATSLALLGATPRIEELQAGQINHAIGLTIGDVTSADLAKNLSPANCQASPPNPALDVSGAGISSPATRTDGASTDYCAIPEGLRFRLPASFNLTQYNSDLVAQSKSPLTPMAAAIATAVKNYGFVVDDSCPQPCMVIRIGDPTTYIAAGLPDPYLTGPGVGGVGNSGLFGGLSPTQTGLVMKNFPWDQLEALPLNY